MQQRRVETLAAAAVVVLLGAAAFFGYDALSKGAIGDRCAAELVDAATRSDHQYFVDHVKNPALLETLRSSQKTELLFVRPASSPEWIRIGIGVRTVATATVAQAVMVLLSTEDQSCTFIQEY